MESCIPLGALLDPKHIDKLNNIPQADRNEAETELRRLAKSAVDSTTAQMQLKKLIKKDVFGRDHIATVYSSAATNEAVQWWVEYGGDMLTLQEIAIKVMTMPPTASAGERNWSTWKHIWSNARNRLHVDRVAMLVYIYFNQRALNRVQAQPTAQDWDDFMEYLHNLPAMPEMEGAKTLSEVYDKAEEAKAAAVAARTAAKAAGAGRSKEWTAATVELHFGGAEPFG